MKQVDKISVAELQEMSKNMFEGIVKADIDVVRKIIIVDMGMYADGEAELFEQGSKQNDLWGINLYPDKYGRDEFIEFDSMINIRPSQGNASKDVLDPTVRKQVIDIIAEAVYE